MRYLFLAILVYINLSRPVQSAQVCPKSCSVSQNCLRNYYIGSKKIDLYSNFPLDQPNNCIKQVVFAVHGSERNAQSRYEAALDAATGLSKQDQVLIISPFFKTLDDNPSASDFYWSSSGWRQGNTSNNSGTNISSFSVADAIFRSVINGGRFPYLLGASVTGHSAGGQYAQMYALTTGAPKEHSKISWQFLVLNPSNYTYLNSNRPYPNNNNYFERPTYWSGISWQMKAPYAQVAGNCPNDYNDYKYGVEERNSYANYYSSNTLITQYVARKVYYFLGALDNDSNDESLDKSCEAKLQGAHRLERGKNYFNFLNRYHAGHRHSLGIVDGVGHDSRAMYDSQIVKTALFAY